MVASTYFLWVHVAVIWTVYHLSSVVMLQYGLAIADALYEHVLVLSLELLLLSTWATSVM